VLKTSQLLVNTILTLTALAVGGCAAARVDPDGEEGSAPLAAPACAEATVVRVASDTCPSACATGGVWHGRPTFPLTAPASGRIACSYRWWGASPGAAAEPAALEALPGARVMGEICTTSAPEPVAAEEVSFLATIPPIDGVHGCDVCATLEGSEVYAVFPANLDVLGIAELVTEDGRHLALRIDRPADGDFAVAPLPASLAAEDLVEGAVMLH